MGSGGEFIRQAEATVSLASRNRTANRKRGSIGIASKQVSKSSRMGCRNRCKTLFKSQIISATPASQVPQTVTRGELECDFDFDAPEWGCSQTIDGHVICVAAPIMFFLELRCACLA